MIRKFLENGLTAAPSSLAPPNRYKWRILSAAVWINPGGGSGTRRFQVVKNISIGGTGAQSIGYAIADTGPQTLDTSGDVIAGVMAETNGEIVGQDAGATVRPYVSGIEVTEFNALAFYMTLIAGDTAGYEIIVEEMPE